MMLSDNLPIVKDLPSPEGRWELVEVIGECVCEIMHVRIILSAGNTTSSYTKCRH